MELVRGFDHEQLNTMLGQVSNPPLRDLYDEARKSLAMTVDQDAYMADFQATIHAITRHSNTMDIEHEFSQRAEDWISAPQFHACRKGLSVFLECLLTYIPRADHAWWLNHYPDLIELPTLRAAYDHNVLTEAVDGPTTTTPPGKRKAM